MGEGGLAPHRVVMAAIGTSDRLHDAYTTLRTSDFKADQICAFGISDTMLALQKEGCPPDAPSPALHDLLGSLEPLDLDAGAPVLSTAGSFLHRAKMNSRKPDSMHPGSPACWLDTGSRNIVLDRMRQGNAWLLVTAASHDQWVQGSKLLLTKSLYPIKGLIR